MYPKRSASKISMAPYDLGTQSQVVFNLSALKDLVIPKAFQFLVKAMFPDPSVLACTVPSSWRNPFHPPPPTHTHTSTDSLLLSYVRAHTR